MTEQEKLTRSEFFQTPWIEDGFYLELEAQHGSPDGKGLLYSLSMRQDVFLPDEHSHVCFWHKDLAPLADGLEALAKKLREWHEAHPAEG